MRGQRSHDAYTTNLPKLSANRQRYQGSVALTHFPDGQNDVALQHEGDRLWVGPKIGLRGRTPETRNLQSWGYLIGAQLPIQLQDGCVSRSLRSEYLVVYSPHTFRRESVFPSINYSKRQFCVS